MRLRRHDPPPTSLPDVVWRAGLDLNPLDVTDEADLHWLECLIWPEQDARRDRLRQAAAVARAEPPLLVTGDLVVDLPSLVAQAPPDATLVVFHTAVLGYVEPEARLRFADAVRGLPGHWIANEHPSLLEGLVHVPPTQPQAEGPEPFLTALDGIPVGWSGPHGQFCA